MIVLVFAACCLIIVAGFIYLSIVEDRFDGLPYGSEHRATVHQLYDRERSGTVEAAPVHPPVSPWQAVVNSRWQEHFTPHERGETDV